MSEGDGAWDEYCLADFQSGMVRGEFSSRGLVEYYLDRIARVDVEGPELHAVLQLNDEAQELAGRLDDERACGQVRGALHGVPVLLKGNINTADHMTTTAGSLALRGFQPGHDAALVRSLRKAGAVILGKTNLSEWANFRSLHSSSGWSGEGGQTRNPYALDRNPSGSSSGSAVAVSANLCALAIGTETDGSIVSPASACGVVGMKPTVGLVSREGIIPISASQDTAGPLARTVADAALLLAVIADGLFKPMPAFGHSLQGLRLGYAPALADFLPAVDGIMESARQTLAGLGAVLIETDLMLPASLVEAEFEVMLYELKAGLEQYLQTYNASGTIKTLDDLIRSNQENAAISMQWFGQELFEQASKKGGLDEPAYISARETCRKLSREQGIDRVLSRFRLDALIGPSGSPAWKTDHILGDHFLGGSASLPAIAGYPNISVPAGFVQGLPVGLSIFSGAYSETQLLRVAQAFEGATMIRRKPGFAATVD